MLNNHTISFPFSSDCMQSRIAYDGSDRQEYIGLAPPGVLTSAAQWQIRKCTYSGVSTRLTAVQFAGGVNDYNHVWDDRASYTYS
jgi:hypothetical protein